LPALRSLASGVALAMMHAGCARAADSPSPPAPDYGQAAAWAAWPGRASGADTVPPGLDDGLPDAQKADIFFIHPTTYLSGVRSGTTDSSRQHSRLVWLEGSYQHIDRRKPVCVNPLYWTVGGEAPAAANLGSLPAVRAGADLRPPIPHLTGARCQGAALEVAIPWSKSGGFVDLLTPFGSYHIFDYNIFYTNIRINAQQRVAAWRAAHTS